MPKGTKTATPKPAGLKLARTSKPLPLNARGQSGLPNDHGAFQVANRYLADGLVDIDAVARQFGLTKAALAQTVGFAEGTLQRFSRVNAPKTQQRLREFLEIITRVEPWSGGSLQAMGWYRGQSIPALGDQTAEALVKQDRAGAVRAYLDAYAAGANA
jgi:hypothetical protein